MVVDWLKIWGTVAITVVLTFVLYGAYRFYFDKPVPIVNNSTFATGSRPVISQASGGTKGHLMTGVSFNQKDVMLSLGWLW